ncbi:MAG: GGDEF domain-containing protein [Aeromicrobium sp.]
MDLDVETLLVVRILPIAIVTAIFATTAAMRHNDEANRTWTAAFAAALCVSGLDAIYAGGGTTPAVVVAAGDASTVFAVGAMWSGARLLHSRRSSYLWTAVVAGVAVAVLTIVQSPEADSGLSTTLRTGVAGAFAWLTATELLRGPMRLNLNARILQLAYFLFGGWYVVLSAVSASGITRPAVYATALPLTALFLVSGICLTALRVERAGNWWSASADARRRSTLRVLTATAFREDATDRIQRARLVGSHVALVLAAIDDLDELNAAFGREAGDSALVHFSGVLRSRVPADALLGHLGAGRFVVLVLAASADTPRTVVDAIRTGLTESPLREGMELRTDASFGTSHTIHSPASFDSLLGRAHAELARARTEPILRHR